MAGDIVSSKRAFQGKLINVRIDRVRDKRGREWDREIVERGPACAIVALDPEGRVVLVRQWRPAIDRELLEIPAGHKDGGEDPADCARRELEEETGLVADRVEFLAHFYPSPGFVTEYTSVYLAEKTRAGTTHLDPGEEVEVELLSVDDALARALDGRLEDAKTLVGLLAYAQRRTRAPTDK